MREIRRDAAAAPGETAVRRVPAVQVLPFAALAFLLLCADLLPPRALRRPRKRFALRPAAALLCAALAAGSLAARAQTEGDAVTAREARALVAPTDPVTLLDLGVARARAGLGAEAERAFLAAALYARDPQVASMAYFDLGVTALERGALDAARDAFFDALALAPGDDEARFNLEWTLRALREPPLPPPPTPGNGQADEAATARVPGESGDDAETDAEQQPGDQAADSGATAGERDAAQREEPSGGDEPARAAAEGEADAAGPGAPAHAGGGFALARRRGGRSGPGAAGHRACRRGRQASIPPGAALVTMLRIAASTLALLLAGGAAAGAPAPCLVTAAAPSHAIVGEQIVLRVRVMRRPEVSSRQPG